MDVVFDDAKSPTVEHFAGGGSDAARGDVGDGFAGVVHGFENGEERFDGFGLAREFYRDFGNETERAFGTDEEAGEIVGAGVALFAADADDFAAGENEFEGGDVIGGDTAGEGVRTAGVFGDVAADSGRFLAGGVRREVEAGVFDGARDVEIYYARLNDGALIVEIEFENAIHTRENEHESAGAGECATGEAGASAAAEDGDVVLVCEADDFGNFGGGGREGDEIGASFFDGAVIFIEDEVFGAGEDAVMAQELLQCSDEGAMLLRIRRWWDAGHGVIRVAQMTGCGEMTWTYIGEKLSEWKCGRFARRKHLSGNGVYQDLSPILRNPLLESLQ